MSLGDALGLVGLAIALYQIWRTGRVVMATQRGVVWTEKQIATYSLLMIITELELIESKLDLAAVRNDKEALSSHLRDWQTKASETRGLLQHEGVTNEGLANLLQGSITSATRARTLMSTTTDFRQATQACRTKCQGVCLLAREIAASIRSRAPQPLTTTGVWQDFKELYVPKRFRRGN